MGLDMYLTAKRYISEYADQDKTVSTEIMRHFPELTAEQTLQEISVRMGYWRKANAIHKWFVDQVQNGVDNCGTYLVSREQLIELQHRCKVVLGWRGMAIEQLPPADGFFFGNAVVDEWYYLYLENTDKIIEQCLSMPKVWEFEYSSSW